MSLFVHVLLAVCFSFVEATITSYGVKVGWDGSVASVELRLYWGNEIYSCSVTAMSSGSEYHCFTNQTSTQLVSITNTPKQYSMQIKNDHIDSVWIDSIFVIDTYNSYTIDDFCVGSALIYPLNIWYSYISASNECNAFNNPSGAASLSQIGIDSDNHMLTSINVYFREHILKYANSINPGYVTSSQVDRFGITTSSDGAAVVSSDILLTLYWNLEVIQCIINPVLPNTLYLCYVSHAATTSCFNNNQYENEYKIQIENDNIDALEIQSIVVYDKANYYYGITNFCVNNNVLGAGRDLLTNNCTKPTEFQYFKDICLDNVDCNSPYLDIEFDTNLFSKPNTLESNGIVMPGIATSTLTCTYTPTPFPTSEPTPLPTNPPSESPTKKPTLSPSNPPTNYPSWLPTTDPSIAPTPAPTNNPTTKPSENPSKFPSIPPTKKPTALPTESPTEIPSRYPTKSPTQNPSQLPSKAPSMDPTKNPFVTPTKSPSKIPSAAPTQLPTLNPSNIPSLNPSKSPTVKPTHKPTSDPTKTPTMVPSEEPTDSPTPTPTSTPSKLPTNAPTDSPTSSPTNPTSTPTAPPTYNPTATPTWFPSISPTPQPTVSPTFKATFSDNYIHVYVGNISWIEANEYCEERFNTSLAFIGVEHDNGEAAYLVQLQSITQRLLYKYAFFGYNKFYKSDKWRFVGKLGWSDNWYTNWDVNNGQPGSGGCGVMGEDGYWYTTSCSSRQNIAILCNRYSDIVADVGAYKYVFIGETTWTEANRYCDTQYDTTLATINTKEENTKLAMFATHQFNTYAIIQQYESWIGLMDMGNKTKWTDATDVTYINFHPQHQDILSESCVYIESPNGYWGDHQCHLVAPMPFFCNAPKTNMTIPPTLQPIDSPTQYPTMSQIEEYSTDGNYIYIHLDEAVSWFDANEKCLDEYGTYLATISSPDLNLEATYSINVENNKYNLDSINCTFIGLNDLHQSTDWKWIDNEIVDYSNLANTQFINNSGNKRCAYLCNQGTWYSVSCQLQCDYCSILCNAPTLAMNTTNDTDKSGHTQNASTSSVNWSMILIIVVLIFLLFACLAFICYRKHRIKSVKIDNQMDIQMDNQIDLSQHKSDPTRGQNDVDKSIENSNDSDSDIDQLYNTPQSSNPHQKKHYVQMESVTMTKASDIHQSLAIVLEVTDRNKDKVNMNGEENDDNKYTVIMCDDDDDDKEQDM